jgi:DNA recombination protein RmuC
MMTIQFFSFFILSVLFCFLYYRLKKKLNLLNEKYQNLSLSHQEVQLHITSLQERLHYAQQLANDHHDHFSHKIEQIVSNSLQRNHQDFWKTANDVTSQIKKNSQEETTSHQKKIGDLITPLNETLVKVQEKVNELEKERLLALNDLKHHIVDLNVAQKELRQETAKLFNALKNPTTRGQWGEMQLRRVVELAGMLEYCDFISQYGLGESKRRPDMVINLPGGKKIILDAKVALYAYLEYLETSDAQKKEELLKDHLRQIRTHIRDLSQKAYWEELSPTPEFVVMFLPSEAIFSIALEQDPSLIEVGVREKVILATPTTLIALLRTVAYGWRQESIAINTQKISDLGRELCKRLGDMSSHFQRLGRNLSTAVDAYNQTIGSFEQRVLVSAKKFEELDQGLELKISLEGIDTPVRSVTKI